MALTKSQNSLNFIANTFISPLVTGTMLIGESP